MSSFEVLGCHRGWSWDVMGCHGTYCGRSRMGCHGTYRWSHEMSWEAMGSHRVRSWDVMKGHGIAWEVNGMSWEVVVM